MTIYRKFAQILTKKEQKSMIILSFLMLIAMLFEAASVGLVMPTISLMTNPSATLNYPIIKSILPRGSQIQWVVGAIVLLTTTYVIKTIFMVFMIWKQNQFVYGVQASLSERLFNGYLHQPWPFHLQRNSAQLIANTSTEVNIFSSNSLQAFMILLTEGSALVAILMMLFIMEPMDTFIILLISGASIYFFHLIIRDPILRWGKARQYHEKLRIQNLQQGLGGVKEVKLLGREDYFYAQYHVHNQASALVGQKQKTMADLPRLLIELGGIFALVTLVSIILMQGLPLGGLLPIIGLFATAAFRAMPSLNRILGNIQNFRYSIPVIDYLSNELKAIDSVCIAQRKEIMPFERTITLERIDYHYPETNILVLRQFNLTIRRGAFIGIVGQSGAGKSTLVDLILGLLTPTHGKIQVDGIDIQTNLRAWQNQIGYVPQSIYLTDDTIRKNIAFGITDDQIDENALIRALKTAQLEEFVKDLPLGLETIVGERGVRLSGGQRQRIGIARALYHDPSLLVLDEATSALDVETEKEVMKAVIALHGFKTIIIVAHRHFTVSHCDWIYRVDQGSILQQGTFENLFNNEMGQRVESLNLQM